MYTIAITGASGAIIGIRLIEELLGKDLPVSVVVTPMGWQTINHELFQNQHQFNSVTAVLKQRNSVYNKTHLAEYHYTDFNSPLASGSAQGKAVIVAPLSMKSMAAMANGYADNLVTRAVDVALKEERKTILVPRETPLSTIHLENMLKLKRAGASIVIPVPSFYAHPRTIDDIINFLVGKICALLDIEHDLIQPWGN